MSVPSCIHGMSGAKYCTLCEHIRKVVDQVSHRVEERTIKKMGIIPYSRPFNPTFACMERRRRSYSSWLFYQDSNELAEAGFYYTGFTDLVVCFQCGVEIAFWMPGDIAIEEHTKHASDCFYLKVGKFEDEVPGIEVPDHALCKICLLREREIVFLPCGHFMCCRVCIFQIEKCSTCRKEINGIHKVFPC